MGGQRYALGTGLLALGVAFLYMAFTPKGQQAWAIIATGIGGYSPTVGHSGTGQANDPTSDTGQRSVTPTPPDGPGRDIPAPQLPNGIGTPPPRSQEA